MADAIVILAAGRGSRMRSALPKVLHPIAGKPLLEHVILTAKSLKPAAIYVVVGFGKALIQQQLAHHADVHWVEQTEQLGTGHAVLQALPQITTDRTLVLYGDGPMITHHTLQKLLQQDNDLTLLTAEVPNPHGLGRVLRDDQQHITAIVEEKDATPAQKTIHEINTGILVSQTKYLREWLPKVTAHNQQHEYYLPDIIPLYLQANLSVGTMTLEDNNEILAVNDREQLAAVERHHQLQVAQQLMHAGVTLKDPARFDARGALSVAQDVTIDVDVIFEGHVSIGANSYIGPFCHIKDAHIGANVVIKSHSVIEDAVLGDNSVVGPFARLRPGTKLGTGVRIGNFVEVKQSTFGDHSKANHLSYIGDTTLGSAVNVGAGTITCNYDGVNKHQTTIGDGAFIGSNSSLVAPVEIGTNATIGAGSTITKDAPANTLTVARSKQTTIAGWQRPRKKNN